MVGTVFDSYIDPLIIEEELSILEQVAYRTLGRKNTKSEERRFYQALHGRTSRVRWIGEFA